MLFCGLNNIRKTSLFPRDPLRLAPWFVSTAHHALFCFAKFLYSTFSSWKDQATKLAQKKKRTNYLSQAWEDNFIFLICNVMWIGKVYFKLFEMRGYQLNPVCTLYCLYWTLVLGFLSLHCNIFQPYQWILIFTTLNWYDHQLVFNKKTSVMPAAFV